MEKGNVINLSPSQEFSNFLLLIYQQLQFHPPLLVNTRYRDFFLDFQTTGFSWLRYNKGVAEISYEVLFRCESLLVNSV